MTFDSYDEEIADGIMALDAASGGLPQYLGLTTTEVGPGHLTAEIEVRPDLLNPFGTLHGGVLAALVDHVLGAVMYPLVPQGTWVATTELKLNLIAPVREGVLSARAEVLSMSRRLGVVRIDATNLDRLVGAAQGTVTITEPRPKPG